LVQETRLWNADQEITLSMRSKEYAHDYRYFPEPDLVPLVIEPAWIEEIRRSLPELPEAKRQRFVRDYGIPEYDAGVLTTSPPLAAYYEAAVKVHNDPKTVSNWVMVELLGRLNKDGKDIAESPIPPERLGAMLGLLAKGTISGKMAKEFFDEMYATGADPADILKQKGGQIADPSEVEKIVRDVLAKHPGPVAEYKSGKEGPFNFLIGQVMKATRGKANPQLVSESLKKALQGS
jgi:aspartyl-tRNA(Asn)/glutamyl-tRNA(Gln) amidotransferase subunit B